MSGCGGGGVSGCSVVGMSECGCGDSVRVGSTSSSIGACMKVKMEWEAGES